MYGEQLALVVKEDNQEVWRSYTILPPVGVLCAYTKIAAAASASCTIAWLKDDGTEFATTTVADGETPAHEAPVKTDQAPYANHFTGWSPTTFAELSNDAIGADVSDGQIKVCAAGSLNGLKTARPLAAGYTVKEKKSAVKATIEVAAPADAGQQFFKVESGK